MTGKKVALLYPSCKGRSASTSTSGQEANMRTVGTERDQALTEAWQTVDRAITPLGYGGGATNSPWNQGYERAKNEALNVILALRDGQRHMSTCTRPRVHDGDCSSRSTQ